MVKHFRICLTIIFLLLPSIPYCNSQNLKSLAEKAFHSVPSHATYSLEKVKALEQEAQRHHILYYEAFALNLKGMILNRQLKFADAVKCLDRALDLQPPLPLKLHLLTNKAHSYLIAGQAQRALELLHQAEKILRQNQELDQLPVLSLKVRLLAKDGQTKEAKFLLEELMNKSPKPELGLYIELATIQMKETDWPAALETLQSAPLPSDTSDSEHAWNMTRFFYSRGICFMEHDRTKAAIADFKQGLNYAQKQGYHVLSLQILTLLKRLSKEPLSGNYLALDHKYMELSQIQREQTAALYQYHLGEKLQLIEKQNEQLTRAKEKQKWLLYFCIGTFSLLLSILFLWIQSWIGKQRIRKALNNRNREDEYQKEVLQARIGEQKAYINYLEAEKARFQSR